MLHFLSIGTYNAGDELIIVPCTDPGQPKSTSFPASAYQLTLAPNLQVCPSILYPSLLMSHECDIGIVLPVVTESLPYYEPTLTLL